MSEYFSHHLRIKYFNTIYDWIAIKCNDWVIIFLPQTGSSWNEVSMEELARKMNYYPLQVCVVPSKLSSDWESVLYSGQHVRNDLCTSLSSSNFPPRYHVAFKPLSNPSQQLSAKFSSPKHNAALRHNNVGKFVCFRPGSSWCRRYLRN